MGHPGRGFYWGRGWGRGLGKVDFVGRNEGLGVNVFGP